MQQSRQDTLLALSEPVDITSATANPHHKWRALTLLHQLSDCFQLAQVHAGASLANDSAWCDPRFTQDAESAVRLRERGDPLSPISLRVC
jgi:hypothetical protein